MQELTKYVLMETPSEGDIEELWQLLNPLNEENVAITGLVALSDPDGFPYLCLVVNAEPGKDENTLDKAGFFEKTVMEGRGIALSTSAQPNLPVWSIRYNVVLSLTLFGTPRPVETLRPPEVTTPIPYGAPDMIVGSVRESALPDFAREIVNARLGKVVGHKLDLEFEMFEIPSYDAILRIRIDLADAITSQEMFDAVAREIEWCLPYVVVTFSQWRPTGSQSADSDA